MVPMNRIIIVYLHRKRILQCVEQRFDLAEVMSRIESVI